MRMAGSACGRFRIRWTWLAPTVAATNALVWTVSLVISNTSARPQQVLGEFLSTTAIILFSSNLILVTRARPLERGFGGLDKLFASHRADGIIGALIITAHFLVIPKSAGLVPSKPFGYVAIAWVLVTVLVAAAPRTPWRNLVPLPYHHWKFLHRFNGVLVALAATHSLLAPTVVRTNAILIVWVYGVVSAGLAAYLYREFLFPRVGPFRSLRIHAVRPLTDRVTELKLDPIDAAAFQRRAGQFAFVSMSGGLSGEQHPFTISSPPNEAVRFSIKASGDWTDELATKPPPAGAAARIEGPYGCFDYRLGRRRQLWLAGGVGITPFAAMLPEVDPSYSVLLVWSVREPDGAFYRAELEMAVAERPNVRLMIHPTSAKGHLSIADLDVGDLHRGVSAFICGPTAMRRAFIEQLRALGMPRREIFFEEFTLR